MRQAIFWGVFVAQLIPWKGKVLGQKNVYFIGPLKVVMILVLVNSSIWFLELVYNWIKIEDQISFIESFSQPLQSEVVTMYLQGILFGPSLVTFWAYLTNSILSPPKWALFGLSKYLLLVGHGSTGSVETTVQFRYNLTFLKSEKKLNFI